MGRKNCLPADRLVFGLCPDASSLTDAISRSRNDFTDRWHAAFGPVPDTEVSAEWPITKQTDAAKPHVETHRVVDRPRLAQPASRRGARRRARVRSDPLATREAESRHDAGVSRPGPVAPAPVHAVGAGAGLLESAPRRRPWPSSGSGPRVRIARGAYRPPWGAGATTFHGAADGSRAAGIAGFRFRGRHASAPRIRDDRWRASPGSRAACEG